VAGIPPFWSSIRKRGERRKLKGESPEPEEGERQKLKGERPEPEKLFNT
jgi:hypothetical protein